MPSISEHVQNILDENGYCGVLNFISTAFFSEPRLIQALKKLLRDERKKDSVFEISKCVLDHPTIYIQGPPPSEHERRQQVKLEKVKSALLEMVFREDFRFPHQYQLIGFLKDEHILDEKIFYRFLENKHFILASHQFKEFNTRHGWRAIYFQAYLEYPRISPNKIESVLSKMKEMFNGVAISGENIVYETGDSSLDNANNKLDFTWIFDHWHFVKESKNLDKLILLAIVSEEDMKSKNHETIRDSLAFDQGIEIITAEDICEMKGQEPLLKLGYFARSTQKKNTKQEWFQKAAEGLTVHKAWQADGDGLFTAIGIAMEKGNIDIKSHRLTKEDAKTGEALVRSIVAANLLSNKKYYELLSANTTYGIFLREGKATIEDYLDALKAGQCGNNLTLVMLMELLGRAIVVLFRKEKAMYLECIKHFQEEETLFLFYDTARYLPSPHYYPCIRDPQKSVQEIITELNNPDNDTRPLISPVSF